MIDFNANLIDRIIKDKVDAQGGNIYPNEPNNPIEKYKIVNGLSNILNLFSSLTPENTGENETNKTSTKTIDNNTLADAKNSLRDLIVYFQSITKSPSSNRNIIPTKFSAEMDGIGGLVIGHMFRLPDNILPRGYRGDGVGSQLGNTITSIGHSISNGDWVTKIDSLNIVLNPYANNSFQPFDVGNLNKDIKEIIESSTPNIGGKEKINTNVVSQFGKVDSSIPDWARALLDMISYTEGTSQKGKNGYDVIVGGGIIPNWNENYTGQHPKISVKLRGLKDSTAAGRYQFLYSTWKEIKDITFSSPFNKLNQDKGGFYLIKRRLSNPDDGEEAFKLALSGIKDVNQNPYFLNILGTGKINFAGEWASLPDKNGRYQYEGQGNERGIQDVYNIYLQAVGAYRSYTSLIGIPTKVGSGLIESPF
jgi:muramidase (phage lysozyme)